MLIVAKRKAPDRLDAAEQARRPVVYGRNDANPDPGSANLLQNRDIARLRDGNGARPGRCQLDVAKPYGTALSAEERVTAGERRIAYPMDKLIAKVQRDRAIDKNQ